jgi:hypothetical protein
VWVSISVYVYVCVWFVRVHVGVCVCLFLYARVRTFGFYTRAPGCASVGLRADVRTRAAFASSAVLRRWCVRHSACRFASACVPPRCSGTTWSTSCACARQRPCSSTCWHRCPARSRMRPRVCLQRGGSCALRVLPAHPLPSVRVELTCRCPLGVCGPVGFRVLQRVQCAELGQAEGETCSREDGPSTRGEGFGRGDGLRTPGETSSTPNRDVHPRGLCAWPGHVILF